MGKKLSKKKAKEILRGEVKGKALSPRQKGK